MLMRADTQEQFDPHQMRGIVRWAFDIDAPSSPSMLGDMQTRLAKGEAKLKRSSGNWGTQVNASPTRKAQFSQVPISDDDFLRCRVMRKIHSLEYPYPLLLTARYNVFSGVRSPIIPPLVSAVIMSMGGCHREVRPRIELMAIHQLQNQYGIAEPWELLQIRQEDWNNSTERKTWDKVKKAIKAMDVDALHALWGVM